MSIASAIQNAQTKIAAAYTACDNKGATMPTAANQNLSNLATTIGTIPTGGGPTPATPQYTVTWYDYDGTVLKTETVDEGGSSTAPTVPSHQLLTFREWVHGNTITNVTQDYFNIARHAYIGEELVLKVNIDASLEYKLTVGVYKASNLDPVVFDWGDGTSDTHTENNRNAIMTHTYSSAFTGFVKVYSSSGANIQNLNNNSTFREAGVEEYYCGSKFVLQDRAWWGRWNPYLKAIVLPDSLTTLYSELCSSFIPKVIALPTTLTTINSGNLLAIKYYKPFAIEAINIPSSVTSIGNSFLQDLSSLKYVTSTINATSIGTNCFRYCENLSGDITFTNVTTFNNGGVFAYCYKLRKVVIQQGSFTSLANTNGGFFDSCYELEEVVFPTSMSTLTTLGNNTFGNCYKLTEIKNLPTSITTIGDGTFHHCSLLVSISLTSISSTGKGVFRYCSNLESVTLGGTYTTLGNNNGGYFDTCVSLKTVTLPSSLSITTIESSAFYGCENLETITNFPKNATTIGDSAFYNCKSLTTAIEFTNVTSLGKRLFYGCQKVQSIKLGGTFTALTSVSSQGVFQNCESLTSVEIPNTVTSYDVATFQNCYSLSLVPLPTSLTTIGNSAFNSLSSLTSLTIPDTVTSINQYFCAYCSNLRSLHIGLNTTIANASGWLQYCINLREVDCTSGWIPNTTFNCANDLVTSDSWETFFTHLGDNTGNASKTLKIGQINLNKLSNAQKEIATNKNYVLSS